VAEETTNSLLVRASPSDWEFINRSFRASTSGPSKCFEVTIAEVSRTHDLNVGISEPKQERRPPDAGHHAQAARVPARAISSLAHRGRDDHYAVA